MQVRPTVREKWWAKVPPVSGHQVLRVRQLEALGTPKCLRRDRPSYDARTVGRNLIQPVSAPSGHQFVDRVDRVLYEAVPATGKRSR